MFQKGKTGSAGAKQFLGALGMISNDLSPSDFMEAFISSLPTAAWEEVNIAELLDFPVLHKYPFM